MEFKIDTKPTYAVITPVSNELNAKMTEALRQKWRELQQSGSGNLIVDLHNFISVDESTLSTLEDLHEEIYGEQQSLVFTGLQEEVLEVFKATEAYERLNIAPTLIEAIDIVSMEILERDLFNEES